MSRAATGKSLLLRRWPNESRAGCIAIQVCLIFPVSLVKKEKAIKRIERIWMVLFFLTMASLAVSAEAFKRTCMPWMRGAYRPVELVVQDKETRSSGRSGTSYCLIVTDPERNQPYSACVPWRTYEKVQLGERKKFLFNRKWSRFEVTDLDMRLIAEEDFPPSNSYAPWIVAGYVVLAVALIWCYQVWRRKMG